MPKQRPDLLAPFVDRTGIAAVARQALQRMSRIERAPVAITPIGQLAPQRVGPKTPPTPLPIVTFSFEMEFFGVDYIPGSFQAGAFAKVSLSTSIGDIVALPLVGNLSRSIVRVENQIGGTSAAAIVAAIKDNSDSTYITASDPSLNSGFIYLNFNVASGELITLNDLTVRAKSIGGDTSLPAFAISVTANRMPPGADVPVYSAGSVVVTTASWADYVFSPLVPSV